MSDGLDNSNDEQPTSARPLDDHATSADAQTPEAQAPEAQTPEAQTPDGQPSDGQPLDELGADGQAAAAQSAELDGGQLDGGQSDIGQSDTEALSVDQLTAAFANLMGDDEEEDDADDELLEAATDDESAGGATATPAKSDGSDLNDQDSDLSQVTPLSIVEAIMFVGHPNNEPVTARLMASYLRGVSPGEVDSMIVELNEAYEEQGASYRITSEGAGYRMTLREDLGWLREAFYGKVREAKLTQAAIDLLAIVAYNQPVERSRVDDLRGQPSGGVLSQLVRRELLSVEYTKEKPRKKLYSTTDRFLELFGLETIEDLPSYEDF